MKHRMIANRCLKGFSLSHKSLREGFDDLLGDGARSVPERAGE